MKKHILMLIAFVLVSFLINGCIEDRTNHPSEFNYPTTNHDLSYIPFNPKTDDPNFVICDSTRFASGRNGIQYIGGTDKLKNDILSEYKFKDDYASFNGFVVVQFLVNCEGKTGRYRSQSLNLDFSPATAPADLITYATGIIRSLDNWTKRDMKYEKQEYSKYINLKIHNGKIQHILL